MKDEKSIFNPDAGTTEERDPLHGFFKCTLKEYCLQRNICMDMELLGTIIPEQIDVAVKSQVLLATASPLSPVVSCEGVAICTTVRSFPLLI